MARDRTPTQIGPDGPVPRGARIAGNGRPYLEVDGFAPELEAIGAVFGGVLRAQISHDPADVLFRGDAVEHAAGLAAELLSPRLMRELRNAAQAEIEAARAIAAAAVKSAGGAS